MAHAWMGRSNIQDTDAFMVMNVWRRIGVTILCILSCFSEGVSWWICMDGWMDWDMDTGMGISCDQIDCMW